jgi:hypothetical protein
MKVTTRGSEVAKRLFPRHGVDEQGKVAIETHVIRSKLRETVVQLPPGLSERRVGERPVWRRRCSNWAISTRRGTGTTCFERSDSTF